MERFYIGLATSFHDPAVAVVNSSWEVVFAEASERYLQDKRAQGSAADVRETVRRIIRDYCDPRGEYIIAKSWSRKATRALDLLYLLGFARHERLPHRPGVPSRFLADRRALLGSVWQQHTANKLSGGHFADVLSRLGRPRVSYVAFPHHLTHAATGGFTSPFEQAACMVVDGHGEGGSISYFEYREGRIRLVKRMQGAESLGTLYSLCTDLFALHRSVRIQLREGRAVEDDGAGALRKAEPGDPPRLQVAGQDQRHDLPVSIHPTRLRVGRGNETLGAPRGR